MRLSDGTLFPIPITLTADPICLPELGVKIVLRDPNFDILAFMNLEEIFPWSKDEEAKAVYGTLSVKHPMIDEMSHWGRVCISGELEVVHLPKKIDFTSWRHTPRQLRKILQNMDAKKVVGFQTRNPLHRVHEEITKRAAQEVGGVLLIHPVVGMTKPGDVSYYTRARTYISLYENYYDKSQTLLSFLPFAMRMAGPREALMHAIIRRNYGVSHFIVGRDHAGCGAFYGPYDAQNLVEVHQKEISMSLIPLAIIFST
jgi:sulfate adenylyltransferase